MDTERFDQLAKAFVAVGSRRWVIGGLLGGALGLSRIGAAGANHKPGHRCTPSAKHACQGTCVALGQVCATSDECCQDQASTVFCCEDFRCDTDCLD